MKKKSEFVEFLHETFEEFGAIEVRRMFGGYGIYRNGLMFGLVEKNTLYLKGDEATQRHFKSGRLPQFQYNRAGKVVKLSYFKAPEEVYDDRGKAALWAQRAYTAALRQSDKKKKRKEIK